MLTFFPTPYPSEWWYSVLCRYHVRTGNDKYQTTMKELFQGRETAAINAVWPNSTISVIAKQLEPTFLDTYDVTLEHTLFRYYTRCFPLAQKVRLLERVCMGQKVTITSIRRVGDLERWTPRYCPLCVAEDRKTYGEAYWHIDHQIPLMQLCPVHSCRLELLTDIEPAKFRYRFCPLESYELLSPDKAVQVKEPEWLPALSKILAEYYVMPLPAAATPGYHNTAMALYNMGYGVIQKTSANTILDSKRLYRDLVNYFGRPMVEQVFGDERAIPIINRVCKWESSTPERHAMLQCFAGMDSYAAFCGPQILDAYEVKLKGLQKKRIRYGRKQVAEQLGITVSQLEILAEKYSIQPFWKQVGRRSTIRSECIRIMLTTAEKELLARAAQVSGNAQLAVYARAVLLHTAKDVVETDQRTDS